MKTVRIIYSTTSGNTELVIRKIEQLLKSVGIDYRSQRASDVSEIVASKNEVLILACATYGHGVLQGRMRTLIEKRSKDIDLSGVACAVVGLGDDKYDREYNVESAAILERFVVEHGGDLVCNSLRINRSPLSQLETKVATWGKEFIKKIS